MHIVCSGGVAIYCGVWKEMFLHILSEPKSVSGEAEQHRNKLNSTKWMLLSWLCQNITSGLHNWAQYCGKTWLSGIERKWIMFLISRPSKPVDVFPGLFVNPAARTQHMCSACMSRCSMTDLSFLNNVWVFFLSSEGLGKWRCQMYRMWKSGCLSHVVCSSFSTHKCVFIFALIVQ